MPANCRSKRLTPEGVKKVRLKITQEEAAANKNKTPDRPRGGTVHSRLLECADIHENTLKSLLSGKTVLAKNFDRVCECLSLTLTAEDWTGVAALPRHAQPPQKGSITTIAGYPVSECIGKMKAAKDVDFLNTWMVNKESLASHLVEDAYRREGKTRILVLDPLSAHVNERAIDMNGDRLTGLRNAVEIEAEKERLRANVRVGIRDTLREISRLAARHASSGRLEVRVYDSTPAMTVFRVDDYCCQGVYWRDHAEASTPHLVFTRQQNEAWFETVEAHFEAVWNRNTTYRYDIRSGEIVREP